uniref:Reverse transcriptase Ty1/copia-type domain-containing protein n=1 Tax=Tanacetum cinerariifolium TaxID=118510 RepID=A0A6L2KRD6_TANCI|nr:hypothetical protein [Tanacetum cinerariifolium]
MASSMSPELQNTFENTWAFEMNQQLKEMFQEKASKERLDVVKSLMACKPKPEAAVCAFVLEMKGYFDRLESLNMVFDAELSINIILSGLKRKFDRGSKRKVESDIAPTSDPKEAMCFYYNTKGHGKRSCPKYLKDLKDGKVEKGSHSVKTDTQQEVVTPVKPDDISLPIRKTSGRVSEPPQFYYGLHIKKDKISDNTLSEFDKPVNYKEAMASLEAVKWNEAIKIEIQSMYDNQVWNLVDNTPGLKTMGCKWIFKKKTGMDGKVHTYKARWMSRPLSLTKKLIEDMFMAQPQGLENAKKRYPNVTKCKRLVGKCFAMKDLGDAAYILGIKITEIDDSRSQSGWVFLLNGGAMTWKSSKKYVVADSTCESEYIAACEASKEAI